MKYNGIKSRFLSKTKFRVLSIIIVLCISIALLWHGNKTSNQAKTALVAQVYFDGEYRVADGPWQSIEKGEHIPATDGDVTLRGYFHILAPDGEYAGICGADMPPIAFYTDHISVTIYEDGFEPTTFDSENTLYGDSACGATWNAHTLIGQSEKPIEILIHNPHTFGNETAIDEMLSKVEFWTGV